MSNIYNRVGVIVFKTRITEMFGIEYPSVRGLIDGIINEAGLICQRLY